MSIFQITLSLLASADEVTGTQMPGNSSSFDAVPVAPEPLMSFLPLWKQQLEKKQVRINVWMDSDQDMAERIVLFAVVLMVLKACWIWSCKGLEVGKDWWEERERKERFKEWMIEERRIRRERKPIVGILRGRDGKVVRKRVSWEQDGRGHGETDGRGDLEGQRKQFEFGRGGVMIEEVKCEEIVLDVGFPSSCST
jgi:hypothetical protein